MVKHLFILLLFFSCNSAKEQEQDTLKQERDTLQFVEYKVIESTFKSGQNVKRLKEDFNMFSGLLLDSIMAKVFYDHHPGQVPLHEYWLMGRLSKSTVGFRFEAKTLKDVLLSKTSRERILNCVYNEETMKIDKFKIINPIYIKENIAIVTISNQASFDTYKITLLDGVVQINFVTGSIE